MNTLTRADIERLLPDAEFVCETTDRPTWLKARRTGVTASAIARILGLSPYGNAATVVADVLTPDPNNFGEPETFDQKRGLILEPTVIPLAIAAGYLPEGSRIVQMPLLRSRKYPTFLASCDPMVITPEGEIIHTEIKTVGSDWKGDWGEEWSDETPEGVWCQTAGQAIVTGAKRILILALVDGRKFKPTPYWYTATDELHDSLITGIPAWWQRHIVNRAPIDPDGEEHTTQAIRRLVGTARKPKENAPEELWPLLYELLTAEKAVEAASKAYEKLKQAAILAIGDRAGLSFPGGTISHYQVNERDQVNPHAVAKEYLDSLNEEQRAEVLARCKTHINAYRVFRTYPKK